MKRKRKSAWVVCKNDHMNLRETVLKYGEGKCPQCGCRVRGCKAPIIGVPR